ncbi:MAG TPA: mandelate racemase/muconate lactonizing enzyme family protein [Bryobacteraceae bacterium]|nr:mandelate racemase/muconate lactonizing enzyme family protein [Bryobacteraceae bacterium]
MKRRSFLQSIAAASGAALSARFAHAALPAAKITRVRFYEPPNPNPTFAQSNLVVTVETNIGITGTGEGGTHDMLEQCAGTLIGKDPFKSESLWQEMYMIWFYSPGREKIHALGALDMALWDIKGKALQLPLHQILGGAVRDYCEAYPTSGVGGGGGGGRGSQGRQGGQGGQGRASLAERAHATIEAGYRAFRIDAGAGGPLENNVFNTHERVRAVVQACKEVREGVGPNGDWSIDLHQKFDYPDALRCCKLIEDLEPYLVEDPTREEQFLEDIPKLRRMTTVPIAAGEEWGQRWDFNKLVENHDIDYNRCTLPNVGGITEYLKIMSLCGTHVVGMVPHFTGPISTAALVNCLATFPGPVLFEYNYGDRPIDYLPEFVDFRKGKLYPNMRPGLGVTLDMKPLKMISEVTQPYTSNRIYRRPDGSFTHW